MQDLPFFFLSYRHDVRVVARVFFFCFVCSLLHSHLTVAMGASSSKGRLAELQTRLNAVEEREQARDVKAELDAKTVNERLEKLDAGHARLAIVNQNQLRELDKMGEAAYTQKQAQVTGMFSSRK